MFEGIEPKIGLLCCKAWPNSYVCSIQGVGRLNRQQPLSSIYLYMLYFHYSKQPLSMDENVGISIYKLVARITILLESEIDYLSENYGQNGILSEPHFFLRLIHTLV